MAITHIDLAEAIRADETSAARLRPVVVSIVERYAPDAPPEIKDEAAIRIAAYLFDAPPAPSGHGHANALTNSGAGALLSSWKVRRAGVIDA